MLGIGHAIKIERYTLARCKDEAFFKAISKPGAETWPIFRFLRKFTLNTMQ